MAGLTAFSNAQGENYLNNYDFTPHAYTRTQPVQGWVQEAIANAVYSVDPELQIRVTSGGQPSSRDPAKKGAANGWTGSTRHNEGGAADFALVRNGEVLPISANKSIYQSVARNLAAQGVPGIGVDVGSNFIHAGGGDVAAWGYQGSSNGAKYLDPDFATSIQEGRSMAQTGGIPRPPGMVGSPPGSSVASQLSTIPQASRQPLPQSQSNALSRERSVIPPGLPPALGAGMARLASSGAREANLPVPATPSTAMRAARQPNLMADTFGRVMPRVPPQPMAADMRATLANPATPFLNRDGQGVTDPAAAVFGAGMATNIGLPRAPAPPSRSSLYAGGGPTRPPTDQVGIAPTGRPMLDNGDGSVSTEQSITITDPRLNTGQPTNIPTIWGGRRLSDEQAINSARASGQTFTAFPSIAAAERAAEYRSANEILRPNIPQRFAGQEGAPSPQQTEAQRLAVLYAGGGPTRPWPQWQSSSAAPPPPVPAQMSPQLAGRRATDPVLQAALDARYAPKSAPAPMPRPTWMPQVGTQIAVTPPLLPRPRAPVPASMSTEMAMRRTPLVIPPGMTVTSAMLPQMHAQQIRAPLRITVNGGNVPRPPMPSLEDRITGRAYERSSNNSSLSSI